MKYILLIALLLSLSLVAAYALTPAGTVIENSATLTYDGGTVQSNSVKVTVAQVAGVDITLPADARAQAGKIWSGYLSITNLGNGMDSFSLTSAMSKVWPISLPYAAGALKPNETRQIPFSITIPSGTAGQVDSITIIAISQFDSRVKDSAVMNLTAFKQGRRK